MLRTIDDWLNPRPRITECCGDGGDAGGGGSGVDGVGVGSGVGNNTSQGNAGSVATDSTGVGIGSQTPGVAGPANAAESAASAAAAAAAADAATNAVINAILGQPQSMQNMQDINEMETGPQAVAPGPESHTGIGVIDDAINAVINPQVAQQVITIPAALASMAMGAPIGPGVATVAANAIGSAINAVTGSTNEGAQAAIDSGTAPGGGDGDGSVGAVLSGTGDVAGATADGSTSAALTLPEYRQSSLDALRGLFPSNYVQSEVPFSLDDLLIESILGSQRGVAESSLTNALKRGQISDTGFNAGLSTLSGQTEKGRSLYQTRGEDVLRGYRTDLQGIIDDAFTTAGSLPTTDTPFDPDTFATAFGTRKNDLFSRLEGDIRNAVSASSPFDPGEAINTGASASGPVNFLPDVLSRRNRGTGASDRGLGTRGVF